MRYGMADKLEVRFMRAHFMRYSKEFEILLSLPNVLQCDCELS